MSHRESRGWYVAQLLAAVCGTALSLYLLVQHTRLKSGIQDGSSFCNFGRWANCDVVNGSSWSEVAGIPIAAVGAIFYFLALVLAALARPASAAFPRTQRMLAALGAIALLADVALGIIQATVLHTFCLFCTATYLTSLVVYFSARKLSGGRHSRATEAPWPDRAPLVAGLVATLGFAIAVYFIPVAVQRQAAPADPRAQERITAFLSTLGTMPARDIPISPGNGTFGNPAAKVRIVEFSDFQCPFCRRAAATIHHILEPVKDRIHFVFKHFPLDMQCNPAMPHQLHAHACWAAQLVACAAKQGKFWEAHDRLFLEMTDDDFEQGREHLEKLMDPILDAAARKACLENPEVIKSVADDIEAGRALDVKGTPALYVNGKPITVPLNADTLRRIIEVESGR